MNKFIFPIVLAFGLVFASPSAADHTTDSLVKYAEGVPIFVRGSICINEEAAVSVLKEYEIKDFDASIELYEKLMEEGVCYNMPQVMSVLPRRLVYSFKDAIAVDVMVAGKIYFLVAKGAVWVGVPV